MLSTTFQVALGGAIGAAARYLSGVGLARLFGPGGSPGGFPVGVLAVNVIGSGLMGLFVVVLARHGAAGLGPFLMTGILGGFTTFSAFSLEAVTLWERGAAGQAALYVGASVALSIGALVLGMALARSLT